MGVNGNICPFATLCVHRFSTVRPHFGEETGQSLRKIISKETFPYSMSEAQSVPEESTTAHELTAFQQNILVILAEEPRYGLAVKRELESYYGSEVNHGRLYPNLDDLVDQGYIEKSELDKRTNQYALTDAGHDVVLGQLAWVLDRFVTDETRADEVRTLLE